MQYALLDMCKKSTMKRLLYISIFLRRFQSGVGVELLDRYFKFLYAVLLISICNTLYNEMEFLLLYHFQRFFICPRWSLVDLHHNQKILPRGCFLRRSTKRMFYPKIYQEYVFQRFYQNDIFSKDLF